MTIRIRSGHVVAIAAVLVAGLYASYQYHRRISAAQTNVALGLPPEWTPDGDGGGAMVMATKAIVGTNGNIDLAIDQYRANVGARPRDLSALTAQPYGLDPGSLRDAWNRPLKYACPGSRNPDGYDLWSVGPDGKDGTPDDIGNW